MTTPPKSAERYRSGCRYWSTACLVILLAGCASQPASNDSVSVGDATAVESREGQGAVVNGKLARFLSDTERRSTITVAESPWGPQVRVTAQPPYYAASGRECRLLNIQSQGTGAEQKAVACANGSGWVTHRPVTHVLSNGSNAR